MSSCCSDIPLIAFGVLADVQYANCDDRPASYDRTKIRFYRDSVQHIEKAFQYWEKHPNSVCLVLQLGDVIDGLCSSFGGSHVSIKHILDKFESHDNIPTFHTIGNHELYNFKRSELSNIFHQSLTKMNIPTEMCVPKQQLSTDTKLYYKFHPNNHFKFISLDCFDVSVLGYDSGHPNYVKAASILEYYHKHAIFDEWDHSGNLTGPNVRFQQMNGAIGHEQLNWLENELADSDKKGEKVIVFGHVNLSPGSSDWSCILWNFDEVISCFHRYHCVVAYLSGHSHKAGYSVDAHNIHYVVFPSVVETPLDETAFSTVSVYADRIEITGHVSEECRILALNKNKQDSKKKTAATSPTLKEGAVAAVKVSV